jgi:hypothetical protein
MENQPSGDEARQSSWNRGKISRRNRPVGGATIKADIAIQRAKGNRPFERYGTSERIVNAVDQQSCLYSLSRKDIAIQRAEGIR